MFNLFKTKKENKKYIYYNDLLDKSNINEIYNISCAVDYLLMLLNESEQSGFICNYNSYTYSNKKTNYWEFSHNIKERIFVLNSTLYKKLVDKYMLTKKQIEYVFITCFAIVFNNQFIETIRYDDYHYSYNGYKVK